MTAPPDPLKQESDHVPWWAHLPWEHQRDKAEALEEALLDMVNQHCRGFGNDKWEYGTGALSANADALRVCGDLGLLEIEDRGMRIVFARNVGRGKW